MPTFEIPYRPGELVHFTLGDRSIAGEIDVVNVTRGELRYWVDYVDEDGTKQSTCLYESQIVRGDT